MRLVLRILGTEVFAIETGDEAAIEEDPGDSTSYPVGFTASPGDQAWETGLDR